MKPQLLIAAAGIPPSISDGFVAAFARRTAPIISCLPLDQSKSYTEPYSRNLYLRLAEKLSKREQYKYPIILEPENLVLLYLHKGDGSESILLERFGTEAMVVPLKESILEDMPLVTGSQRRRVVNALVQDGSRMLRHAQRLLGVIAEEVTNRDNKTCLLLPRMNFGRDFDKVFECVRQAMFSKEGKQEFEKRLRRTSRSLHTVRAGKREYFKGQNGLVFKSPAKAGARHGLAPLWGSADHEASCVIRGRVRFGALYDPKFHYDCAIPREGRRSFPNCHGVKALPRGRSHVNIAPNDNIR